MQAGGLWIGTCEEGWTPYELLGQRDGESSSPSSLASARVTANRRVRPVVWRWYYTTGARGPFLNASCRPVRPVPQEERAAAAARGKAGKRKSDNPRESKKPKKPKH